MKALLFGKNSKNIQALAKSLGFEVVSSNPEVIISYGGDGTLLSAERQFPGLPKLPLRNNQICNKCANHQDEDIVKKLLEGKLKIKEYRKLSTTILYKTLYALNDFVIRNSDPTHTIRFKILQDDIPSKLFIGDGIVLSTPFGSTGYFKSITREPFEKGWGLAFNNTTEATLPIYPDEDEQIGVKLVRGKATLSFDNNPDIFVIDEGSEIIFKLSDQVAKIYEADSLRCPNCQVIRS